MSQVTQIPIARIITGNNDRLIFDQTKLKELSESIKTNGLAQPITVRTMHTCGQCSYQTGETKNTCPLCGASDWLHTYYQIVAGERRFRAIQILDWQTAPCIIREMTDQEAAAIMLAENTSRVDLNPIEEANAYQARITAYKWSVEQVANNAGVSIQIVKNRIALLKLADDIQHLVAFGHFPIGHAQLITPLDYNRQRIAVRYYRDSKNGLSKEAFKPIVSKLLEEQVQETMFDMLSFNAFVETVKQEAKQTITITHAPGDTITDVLTKYAAQLARNGLKDEAHQVRAILTPKPSLWMTIKNIAKSLLDFPKLAYN